MAYMAQGVNCILQERVLHARVSDTWYRTGTVMHISREQRHIPYHRGRVLS